MGDADRVEGCGSAVVSSDETETVALPRVSQWLGDKEVGLATATTTVADETVLTTPVVNVDPRQSSSGWTLPPGSMDAVAENGVATAAVEFATESVEAVAENGVATAAVESATESVEAVAENGVATAAVESATERVEVVAENGVATAAGESATLVASIPSADEAEAIAPLPGLRLRSKPPPKPGKTSSYPAPRLEGPLAVLIAPVVDTVSGVTASAFRPRFGFLPIALGGAALVGAFLLGMTFGGPSAKAQAQVQAQTQAAIESAKVQAFAAAKAALPPLPAVFDLSPPPGAKPLAVVLQAEASARSRLDATALGRHWSKVRFDAVTELSRELKRSPQKLEDKKVRAEVMTYVADRATSRVVLEMLAEVASPQALDLLYETWIGSKERNETTQLAEALLLASDVRKHASAALELALALREKPTQCDAINRLVEVAIREGDRRAAMPLLNTSSRVNCGPSGDQECIKCLASPKDMRKAVRFAAARDEPIR